MSINVEVLIYDYKELVDALIDYGAKDRELLELILCEFGERIGDEYIILNNEYADHVAPGGDPYFNIGGVIDRVFGLEDSFGDVICTTDGIEFRELPNYVQAQDVIDKVMRVRLGTDPEGKP